MAGEDSINLAAVNASDLTMPKLMQRKTNRSVAKQDLGGRKGYGESNRLDCLRREG
jgi:hypothetical protein